MIILIVIGLLSTQIPLLIERIRLHRQRLLIERQFKDAVRLLSHTLRVGVSLSQGIDHLSRDSAEPLATSWRQAAQTIRLGVPAGDALEEMAERLPFPEAKWFSTAVQVTLASGGSLADVLSHLADTLEQREMLREKISAMTAQGKASGILLACLPFALLAALGVVAPEMASPFFTTWIGQAVLSGVMVSIAIGGYFIQRIVRLKVLQSELPQAVDLIALVMQAGLDFQVAVSQYLMQAAPSPLHKELSQLQSDWRMGLSRTDALRALVKRSTGELSDTMRLVQQGLELGASIGPILRAQAQVLRQKQTFQAEKQAALAPIKLLFPLLVFIFPTLFAILFTPIMMQMRAMKGFP